MYLCCFNNFQLIHSRLTNKLSFWNVSVKCVLKALKFLRWRHRFLCLVSETKWVKNLHIFVVKCFEILWCLQENLRRSSFDRNSLWNLHAKFREWRHCFGQGLLGLFDICSCWFYVVFMTRKKFFAVEASRFDGRNCDISLILSLWQLINRSSKIFTLTGLAQFVIRKASSLLSSSGVCRTCFYYTSKRKQTCRNNHLLFAASPGWQMFFTAKLFSASLR